MTLFLTEHVVARVCRRVCSPIVGLYTCVMAIFLILQGEGGIFVSPAHDIDKAVLDAAASGKEERVPPSCSFALRLCRGSCPNMAGRLDSM